MKCEERYFELYGKYPEAIAFCPYRIAPLGAHIDHQNGSINGFAIDKGMAAICDSADGVDLGGGARG